MTERPVKDSKIHTKFVVTSIILGYINFILGQYCGAVVSAAPQQKGSRAGNPGGHGLFCGESICSPHVYMASLASSHNSFGDR